MHMTFRSVEDVTLDVDQKLREISSIMNDYPTESDQRYYRIIIDSVENMKRLVSLTRTNAK